MYTVIVQHTKYTYVSENIQMSFHLLLPFTLALYGKYYVLFYKGKKTHMLSRLSKDTK